MLATSSENQIAVLDTDIFSLIGSAGTRTMFPALAERIASRAAGSLFLCGITAEESLRGALAKIRVDETRGRAGNGYAFPTDLVLQLARYPFLPYDDAADQIFHSFSATVKRTGSVDCKIAAVAQAHGAVVVTRNVRHYASVPGTRFADWTLPDQSPT